MMHVVTGGSGSGKSAFAEQLVLEAGERHRIYIATMLPFGEDAKKRVERHRSMRREKQFETIERYTGLDQLQLPADCTVLLECVSNLTANEMYGADGAHEQTADAVVRGLLHLKRQAADLIVVTNEVFSDGICYDASTMQYLAYLGEINRRIAAEADRVTEVVYGIPVRIK